MGDMPVDERTERIVDVVEDSEALLPEDVEVLRSELRRLREIEEAAREVCRAPDPRYQDGEERGEAIARLRIALDADRGGQGE